MKDNAIYRAPLGGTVFLLILSGQQSSSQLQPRFKLNPVFAILAVMHSISVSFRAVVS